MTAEERSLLLSSANNTHHRFCGGRRWRSTLGDYGESDGEAALESRKEPISTFLTPKINPKNDGRVEVALQKVYSTELRYMMSHEVEGLEACIEIRQKSESDE